MKKSDFRVIKKTNRLGEETFYLQKKVFLFFWKYVKSRRGLLEVYSSVESASNSVLRRVSFYEESVLDRYNKEVVSEKKFNI
jgi:hypothetical protein